MTSVVVGSNTTSKPLSDCQKLVIEKAPWLLFVRFKWKEQPN